MMCNIQSFIGIKKLNIIYYIYNGVFIKLTNKDVY